VRPPRPLIGPSALQSLLRLLLSLNVVLIEGPATAPARGRGPEVRAVAPATLEEAAVVVVVAGAGRCSAAAKLPHQRLLHAPLTQLAARRLNLKPKEAVSTRDHVQVRVAAVPRRPAADPGGPAAARRGGAHPVPAAAARGILMVAVCSEGAMPGRRRLRCPTPLVYAPRGRDARGGSRTRRRHQPRPWLLLKPRVVPRSAH